MLIYKLFSFLYSYTSDNSGAKSALNLVHADFGIDIQENMGLLAKILNAYMSHLICTLAKMPINNLPIRM